MSDLSITAANAEEVKKYSAQGYSTVVSLGDNLRRGTGSTGEEVIAFFSRYGIRFARLD